jgi:hypothetical protein
MGTQRYLLQGDGERRNVGCTVTQARGLHFCQALKAASPDGENKAVQGSRVSKPSTLNTYLPRYYLR